MNTETITQPKQPKKRGPLPGPVRERTTVYLEEELVQWGKQKPGGLSEFIRTVLWERKREEDKA